MIIQCTMHPETIATLSQLDRVQWFVNVGIQEETTTTIILTSWEDALKSCTSPEWEDLCLEAANQYRERLGERSMERFRKWNDIVVELKKFIIPFVHGKIKATVEKYSLPRRFESAVQWDILHLCMECEYADVYPPGFYAGLAYWYANSRFPCGWKGDFPKGKPIIY